jgi:hypothetical protein
LQERWIVVLVTVYFVILIGGIVFISQTMFESLQTQINNRITSGNQSYYNWTQPGTPASVKNVTVYLGDGSHYEGDYKPNVTIKNAWVQDRHASIGSSNLYVDCNLNNSGDGTAYELTLHVLTINQYGKAIETSIKAGGIPLICLLESAAN